MYTWGCGEEGKLGHQAHANKKVGYVQFGGTSPLIPNKIY